MSELLKWTAAILLALLAVSATSCAQRGTDDKPRSSAAFDLPPSPLGEKMVRCMQDAGWEATVNWDGTIVGPQMRTEQVDLWLEAEQLCAEQTRYGDLTQLSYSQIEELYRQEVAEYECLTQQHLSPPSPPTEQVYLDTFATADQYYAIKGVTATPELMRMCPAPTWFLNVDGLS